MLHEDEIARLRQVAAMDPALTVRLCDTLVAAGQAQEAVDICRQVLKDYPEDVELRLALGRALSASGNLEEAQAALFDAVARKRRQTRQIQIISGATPSPAATPQPARPRDPQAPLPVAPSGSMHHVAPSRPRSGEAPLASSKSQGSVPEPILSGGTSRHFLAEPGSLRAPEHTPSPISRKLPPLSPPSLRPFTPLPALARRFPPPEKLAPDRRTPPPEQVEVDDLPKEIMEEAVAALPAQAPAREATPPPAPASPAPRSLQRPSGVHQISGVPPLPPPAPLPEELVGPALPILPLPKPVEPVEQDEPSLAAGVLMAAAEAARGDGVVAPAPAEALIRAAQTLMERSQPVAAEPKDEAAPSVGTPPPMLAPLPEELREVEADRGATPGEIEALARPAPEFDIDRAAAELLADLSPKAPMRRFPAPSAGETQRERSERAFDTGRRRIFFGLWVSLVLIGIGVLVGWGSRAAKTEGDLRGKLEMAERLRATARYSDLREAHRLHLQAFELAPHNPRALALLAETEARLCADHGEDIEDHAYILWRRAQREVARAPDGHAHAAVRRAGMLLDLLRGAPCTPLSEADGRESMATDGDVAARCALQRGDVPTAWQLAASSAGHVHLLLMRGALAFSLGDLEEADHAYRTILDLHPGHERALLGRSLVSFERGREEPLPVFPKESELGITAASYLHLLQGLEALRRGDNGRASAQLDLAEKGSRFDPQLARMAARARLSQGHVAAAEEGLRLAHRLSPGDPDLLPLDAEVALAKGYEDKVVAALLPLAGRKESAVSARLLSVLGRAQYMAGHYRDAAATLERVLKGRPRDVVAQSYLALCKAKLGQERAAFHDLEQLAQASSEVKTPHYALALMSYERRDLMRAAQEAQKALERNPEASYARALYGRILREQGQTRQAIEELSRVGHEAPRLITPHRLLGRMYLDLLRPREARAELGKVISSGRQTVQDYLDLAHANLRLGLTAEAEQVLREARKAGARPGQLRQAELILQSHRGAEEAETAARQLSADRKANPRDVTLALGAAQAWLRAGDTQSALLILESIRALAPLEALLGIGRVHLRLRNISDAEAAYRAALVQWEKAPYAPEARDEARCGLSRALLMRGEVAEASGIAQQIQKESPESPEGPHCLARVLSAQGQIDQALKMAERAFEMDERHVDACVLVADLTHRLKRADVVRQRYQRCLDLDPGGPLSKYIKGALSIIK